MSVDLYFFIEVKDEEGKWHLVKWYSDRKFDKDEPTKWDFQKNITLPDGRELFENYETRTGLAWRDELGWNRSFGNLTSYHYPDDISPELDELLKSHGELMIESRKNLGIVEKDYDYRIKYEMLYLSDMFDACKDKRETWEKRLKEHIKDVQLTEISDRLDVLEKLARGIDVKPKKHKKVDDDYENTTEYYFEDYLFDVLALYRETNELYEKACDFTGNKWLNKDNVRVIYYFN